MTTKLLQHMAVMQGVAADWIAPGEYREHFGQTSLGLEGTDDEAGQADRDRAFALDMVYMLDGPEQREAQFDYMAESARTASGHFHGELVHMSHLADAFASFTAAAREIDRIKKLLFYGEDHAKGRYRLLPQHEHDRTVFEALGVITYAARKSDQEEMTPDGEAGQRAAFILHAILGVASEAGEQVEAIEHTLATGRFDAINLMEESGDTKWYLAMLLRALGFAWDEDERRNIAKLRDRYPEKFTTEAANERDLDAERAILEGALKPTDSPALHLQQMGQRPARKQSSARMSSLAASVMNRTAAGADLDVTQLIADARSLAASVLSQDETPGQ